MFEGWARYQPKTTALVKPLSAVVHDKSRICSAYGFPQFHLVLESLQVKVDLCKNVERSASISDVTDHFWKKFVALQRVYM